MATVHSLQVNVHLIGGGVESCPHALFEPYLAESERLARSRHRRPQLAIALFDHDSSGDHFLPAYVAALVGDRPFDVKPVFIRRQRAIEPDAFSDVDGIVVGGGPTPEYLDGLSGAREAIQAAVHEGAPYLGFSAGAMIASKQALIGGYRLGETRVCPQEWSEDLDTVTIRPGLGLVGFTVDVHTAQAGTLGRTVALVQSGLTRTAVGIDEDTCLMAPSGELDPDNGAVHGRGGVWTVRSADKPESVVVTRRHASW